MKRILIGFLIVPALLLAAGSAWAAVKKPCEPPGDYNHTRFLLDPDLEKDPNGDILREFCGFTVSFDSKDDDDGDGKWDVLRVPHWVAQEVRRWEPTGNDRGDGAWCLDTLEERPRRWFTDPGLFASGVAPNDDSYRNSGFDPGHMATGLLVECLARDRKHRHAAYNTRTLLNAVPQRPKFNRCIWENLEYLTGAWAQEYGPVWIIQGPVFDPAGPPVAWIGDEGERKVAVPDAVFKIVVRYKTKEEKNRADGIDREMPEVLAFLYPQLGPEYFSFLLSCGDTRDYRHARFLTTVDEIEKLTGLDFRLPEILEGIRAAALWEPRVVDPKNRELFLPGCGN